jgi:hypothetical protein
VLKTQIVGGVAASELSPGQVAREFRNLLEEGARLKVVGSAREDPTSLLSLGYTPRSKLELFGATFYLTHLREDDNFRFMLAYVLLPGRPQEIHPRIFYKDSSLIWRSASHYMRSEHENWIGKGDLKTVVIDGEEIEYCAEETTNLPYESYAALDDISRRGGAVRRDLRAVPLVLRRAPDGRFEPYEDFSSARRKAMADPDNLVNGGRNVAWFTRDNDPTSLRFEPGFEPDFDEGVIEVDHLKSRFYGGAIHRFRILSRNRRIQYLFVAAPRHVWIIPPQTLTTELNSYAVRTVDVNGDEDVFIPGFEYHYLEDLEDPSSLHSQIPEGFAGEIHAEDPYRADASPWLEKLPVIQEFRRKVRIAIRTAALRTSTAGSSTTRMR